MRADFNQLKSKKSYLKPLDEEGRRTNESGKSGEGRKKEVQGESRKQKPRPVMRPVVHCQDRSADLSNLLPRGQFPANLAGPKTARTKNSGSRLVAGPVGHKPRPVA